jgi:D-alanine-D-alanine ligase
VAAASVALATSAFAALSLRDVARADLIVDVSGAPTALEVNVSPAMTETSLLPMAAHAAGIELPDIWDRLVLLAMMRRRSAGG